MSGDEIVAIGALVAIVGGAVAVFSVYFSRRSAERMKRLEILQQALQHPALDDATRQELLRLLAADHQRGRLASLENLKRLRHFGRVLLLGGGWILLVSGGAILFLAESGFMRGMKSDPGWAFLVAGFLALSLPIVLRELQSRTAPTTAGQ